MLRTVKKKIISNIDRIISRYIGLPNNEITPVSVEMENGKVSIINQIAHKRYIIKESWDEFQEHNLNSINTTTRENLGKAIGQAIADNLIISFDATGFRKTS